MGWFATGELNAALETSLDHMEPGKVSDLIRTPEGWHILHLDNTRMTKPVDTSPVTEYELILLGYKGEENQEKTKALSSLIKQISDKDAANVWLNTPEAKGRADMDASTWLGWVRPRDLQSDWQEALTMVSPGKWTQISRVGDMTGALFVAEKRETVSTDLIKMRERVKDKLFGNKLELETRNYLRMLRQKSFVDVRL